MNSFTQTFGGSPVSPSEVAYKAYTFATDLTLYWPQFSYGQEDVVARFMNMTASVAALDVIMPDAQLVSVGYDVIIFNQGSNSFNVVTANGSAIATIASGEVFYIILNDNTTEDGTWETFQFGVGTGSASAAALAGAGLRAAAGLLETNTAVDLQSIDYTITTGNRARLQVWMGGSGDIDLPSATSVGDGFFFPLANNGSGTVTVNANGSDLIDGAATSVFTQTQSGYIISNGMNWYTVGKGIQNNFAVTLLNLNVAGGVDVVETSSQAQNIIQQFTGLLTANINVIVPNTVQLYYVYNNTTGPHSLTVKTAAGTGFVVPQATHVILYCDGTNVVSGFSSTLQVIGTPTYSIGVAGGTANALTGSASNFVLQLGTVVWFTAASLNTGAATMNVQGTGNIAIKKVAPGGLVDVDANDLIPGLVNVIYYNGTYWISVNTVYAGTNKSVSGNQSITALELFNSIRAITAGNYTLAITSTFPPYFYTNIFADGGAITLIPDAADSIQGLSAGTNFVVPRGGSARLGTDAAGKWFLFMYNVPFVTNDDTSNITVYPTWMKATGGDNALFASTSLTYNPSTALLTTNIGGNAGTVTTINGRITAGANIAITGSGTAGSPYSIASSNTGGTVTSVTFTGDGTVLSSTPSGAVTTTGTLAATLVAQTANRVLAGPATGGPATPTFRALVAADIPSLTIALSSLATQAANTVVANATSGAASPTAVALTTQTLLGRLGGDIAAVAIGTGANNIVQLNGSGQLPAVSGALLTNLPGAVITATPTTVGVANTLVLTVDFTTYGSYLLVFSRVNSANTLAVDASSNAGAGYTGFSLVGQQISNITVSSITTIPQQAGAFAGDFSMIITQPDTTGQIKIINCTGLADITPVTFNVSGYSLTTSAVNRIRFTNASGNFSAGFYQLIPIAKR